MAQKADAPLPLNIELGGGWQIVWAAISPTDGSAVSGVTISNANVVATDVLGSAGGVPASYEPLLVPGPGA